jgi:serine/threonine protein phosphatase 1
LASGSERLLVMGDVHGQFEKMQRVLSLCDYQPENDRLVLLGDYVDRGPDSQKVVSEVLRLTQMGATALYGNHEDLMLRALLNRKQGNINPENLEQWFANGGETTLDSYRAYTDTLDEHLDFFANLPRWVEINGYLLVHAGIRPGRLINEQSVHDLIWIREDYILNYNGPQNVVTGHTPVQYLKRYELFGDIEEATQPLIRNHKIFLDTGAAWNGPLTLMDLMSGEYWQS